ncbi:MAG: hypothetical protein K2Q06_15545 [Parvularculaceae bacterium]|nr:hypothetical protein [Parvularculaceae bacterium]
MFAANRIFRASLLCATLSSAAPAVAQNTSTVFNPEVDGDDRAVELRSTFSTGDDGDGDALATRLHFQEPLSESLRLRLIAQARKPNDGSFEPDFVRAELLWQLTRDGAPWATGLRFEAMARNGARPDEVGLHWVNQFRPAENLRLRAHVYFGRQFGTRGLDGLRMTSRASIKYDFGAVGAGFEHYASYGSTAEFLPLRRQSHDFGPTVSFDVADDLAINAGLLFGMTEASDKLQLRFTIAKAL